MMILLPAWKVILKNLELAIWIMPHNVKTHWNSMYDMLSFALKYKEALKELTSDLSNNLHSFKLNDTEWELVAEIMENLKVRPNDR